MKLIDNFEIEDYDPLFSDVHCKMNLSLGKLCVQRNEEKLENATQKKVDIGKWDNQKVQEFRNNLEMDKINELLLEIENKEDSDIESIMTSVNEILISSAQKTFPPKAQGNAYKGSRFIENYSKLCQEKKREYNKAKSYHKRMRTAESHTNLVRKSKEYKKEVRKHALKLKREKRDKLKKLKSENSKEYWKIINGKKKTKVEADNTVLFNHFKELSKIQTITGDCDDNEIEENEYDIAGLDTEINEEEILKQIKDLQNDKAVGIDLIKNEYIKQSADAMLPLYKHLFNAILGTGHIPKEWASGMIIPIYKNKGSKTDPNNYRGITLLSCMAKLFTSIINKRLTIFIENNKLLNENQTGFRKGYSTTDHCFLLHTLIENFNTNKKNLFCAFIDYEKAFDRINRSALWAKIIKIGIPSSSKLLTVIRNLYNETKSCVLLEGKKSEYFGIETGVRQGENLSPMLFSLFLEDLENYMIMNGNNSLRLKSEACNNMMRLLVLMYADDTVLLSNTQSGLQRMLNSLKNYCKQWGMKVNEAKTKILIFGKKLQSRKDFVFDNKVLEEVCSFKYLGITFSRNGKFDLAKKTLLAQGTRAMFNLLRKSNKLHLTSDMMLDLFDKLVVPIVLYGSEIWGYENLDIIEKLHLKFCKYILGVKSSTPSVMVYGELGRSPLSIEVKIRMIGYWCRLLNGKQSKLSVCAYKVMIENYDINNPRNTKWLAFVKSILDDCGLSNIWESQENVENLNAKWLKNKIRRVLNDQFIQSWQENMNSSSKCMLYKCHKHKIEYEKYLVNCNKHYAKYISKFRTCNHSLPIEKGRYTKVERANRKCDKCNSSNIGDEYHYLLECTNKDIETRRIKHIPIYYYQKHSMQKYCQLMSNINNDTQLCTNVGMFMKYIIQFIR